MFPYTTSMGEPNKVKQGRASKERLPVQHQQQQNSSPHLIDSRIRIDPAQQHGEAVRVRISPSELANDVRNRMPAGLLEAKYQLSSLDSEASVNLCAQP